MRPRPPLHRRPLTYIPLLLIPPIYYISDTRSLRTLKTAITLAIALKHPTTPFSHENAAEAIEKLVAKNGGLYIKYAQAMAMQGEILPRCYKERLARFMDGATPSMECEEVLAILQRELGPEYDQLSNISKEPIATASIAQVHTAHHNPSNSKVVLKILKPETERQINRDLFMFKLVAYAYQKLLRIDMLFAVEFVTNNIRKETNFVLEANNMRRCRNELTTSSSLSKQIHIPKTYDNLCTSRLLTMEFVDGVRITDVKSLQRMKIMPKQVMTLFVDFFAFQMFQKGFLHCDPHPGNILVREQNGQGQLCILDHGLYVDIPDELRKDYCKLWRSIVIYDLPALQKLCDKWGFSSPSLLATATSLRPWQNMDVPAELNFSSAIDKVRAFMVDTDKMPLELIFVGRCMRMLQATNQQLGAPVNRIRLLSQSAATTHVYDKDIPLLRRWSDALRYRFSLFAIDIFYFMSSLFYKGGAEEVLTSQLKKVAKDTFNMDIEGEIFYG